MDGKSTTAAQVGPCILQRADGKTVKLICDCKRENFAGAQEFIDHSLVVHRREFKTTEEVAVACGHPIEEPAGGNSQNEPDYSRNLILGMPGELWNQINGELDTSPASRTSLSLVNRRLRGLLPTARDDLEGKPQARAEWFKLYERDHHPVVIACPYGNHGCHRLFPGSPDALYQAHRPKEHLLIDGRGWLLDFPEAYSPVILYALAKLYRENTNRSAPPLWDTARLEQIVKNPGRSLMMDKVKTMPRRTAAEENWSLRVNSHGVFAKRVLTIYAPGGGPATKRQARTLFHLCLHSTVIVDWDRLGAALDGGAGLRDVTMQQAFDIGFVLVRNALALDRCRECGREFVTRVDWAQPTGAGRRRLVLTAQTWFDLGEGRDVRSIAHRQRRMGPLPGEGGRQLALGRIRALSRL